MHRLSVALIVWCTVGAAAGQTAQDPPVWTFNGADLRYNEPPAGSPDQDEILAVGGIEMRRGDLRIGAERAIVLVERGIEAFLVARGDSSGPPRRDVAPPPARRRLTEAVLRARLSSLLSSTGSAPLEPTRDSPARFEWFDSLYAEGNVIVRQGGFETLRAERIYLSAIDDRAVFHDFEMRLQTAITGATAQVVTVRGEQMVRQGPRFTGRDLSVTTCVAGEPHFEIATGEVEIIEREGRFEVRTRGNTLVMEGVSVLPLPSLSFDTGEAIDIPIKGIRGGYQQTQGAKGGISLGGGLDAVGGALHELFGRPAAEFDGEWRLDLDWIRERGFLIDGDLGYGAEGLYDGRTRGFYLDDRGENIREIQVNLDGSRITNRDRHWIETGNRIHLGEKTKLDLQVFEAADPAVLSEFQPNRWFSEELPESSAFLTHSNENRILTAGVRANLSSFSYLSSRALAPFFVEELPSATFDWLSEPILELPGGAPLLATASTTVGQYRFNYDDTLPPMDQEETWRFDQEVELAAPYVVGPFGFRPFVSGRFTHFSNTRNADDDQRWAFSGGATLGTRVSKSWRWRDDDGNTQGLRHVISPIVAFEHLFKVQGDPVNYHQFDRIDGVRENASLRVGALQRLQHYVETPEGREFREFAWLDLDQYFLPISDRDNNGDVLGLFEFEAILRPRAPSWTGLDTVALLVEGEQDWNLNELRTFNTYLKAGVGSVTAFGEYRTDQTERGQVSGGLLMDFRRRWLMSFSTIYDLQLDEINSLGFDLMRFDHDWTIRFGLNFNIVTDDLTFTVNFEPKFGGLFRERSAARFGGQAFVDRTAF